MPVEIGDIIEAAFKADNANRVTVFHEHSARVTDSYFDQEIEICFLCHHFKVTAEGSHTQIAHGSYFL